ncbi:cytochrome P450 6k1-like [Vespa mandarinia]|uniref:cytochrome P450 6k1-like n=1 Tax=Vespa mandarinia TaxID=7446 RepID=UPI00161C4888|nr:cytochrome P450 6k1-like [Vespa mandarinia]XP_035726463.1 cytochrome P450 6k1-like [Vespa mandarinia]
MLGYSIDINHFITILFLSLITLFLYAKYKLSYWNRLGVKCPPIHLIFGNFKDIIMLKNPAGVVLQNIYNFGDRDDDPYIGFYIFHKPALMIRDMRLIKQILVKDFNVFSDRMFGGKNEKDSVGLINLLGINQPNWKYLRTKITPILTGQKLKKMIPLILECSNPMLEYIDNKLAKADDWKEFELKILSSKYTTDVISSLAFGITTNSFNENDTAFWEAGQKILTGSKRGIILIILFYLPEIMTFIEPFSKSPAEFFRRVFWDSMNTREQIGYKREDLIDSLLILKKGEQTSNFKFEGDNLLAQAVAFYIAGFEASSTAITFALYELASHPEYEERLYNEIKSIIKDDEITIEALNEMTFLDAVLEETLRLYPPLPVIDRNTLRDYKLPGTDLTIKKDTPVYISLNGINTDSKYFSNPIQFNPLREKDEKYNSTGCLAFGIGPRSCVGQRLGILITKIAVTTLVMHYKMSLNHNKKNVFSPLTVFTNAASGVHVHLKRRTNKDS